MKAEKPLAQSHIPIWFFPWSWGDHYLAPRNPHPSSFPTPHSIQPTCTLPRAGIHRTTSCWALKARASLCSWLREVSTTPKTTTLRFQSSTRPQAAPPRGLGWLRALGIPPATGRDRGRHAHAAGTNLLCRDTGKSADCAGGNLLLQTTCLQDHHLQIQISNIHHLQKHSPQNHGSPLDSS